MNQLTFDSLPQGPTPAGELGIARAREHAERVHAGWTSEAAQGLREYALRFADFTIDEARAYIAVEEPPELRAWGAATQMAVRRKWIERTGAYRSAGSSNGSPKPVYTRGAKA